MKVKKSVAPFHLRVTREVVGVTSARVASYTCYTLITKPIIYTRTWSAEMCGLWICHLVDSHPH